MPDRSDRTGLVDIPPPSPRQFRRGIIHPDLWLWDAWTVTSGDTLTLFTLALARNNKKGEPITPWDRNDYPFHVRRFDSRDGGSSWRDKGAFLTPGAAANGAMAHNVWSGSAIVTGDALLFGFTGVRKPAPGRSFLQTICLLPTALDGDAPRASDTVVISDPEAQYDEITRAGYYLGPREHLGDDGGEGGGPILAWRDPFLLARADGSIDVFWAAKTTATAPAVAHARLTRHENTFRCDLLTPISLPDGGAFSQAELPKVYRDPETAGYVLLLSTCNRLHEEQPDDQISKEMRLYRAAAPEGPWRPYRESASIIPGVKHLFGGAFSSIDRNSKSATLIAPYTELSAAEIRLTFAPPIAVDLRAEHGAARIAAI